MMILIANYRLFDHVIMKYPYLGQNQDSVLKETNSFPMNIYLVSDISLTVRHWRSDPVSHHASCMMQHHIQDRHELLVLLTHGQDDVPILLVSLRKNWISFTNS